MSDEFNSILDTLMENRAVDLRLYRPSFVERRISKRMMISNCSDHVAYQDLLKENNSEINALVNELMINVSWFFRNPLTWELLKTEILPKVVTNAIKNQTKIIRIWSAGCAGGEEPYSLAILFMELLEILGESVHVQIIATDMDAQAISKAQKGLFQSKALKNVPYGLLTKYFYPSNSHFQIKPEIKELVQFAQYNLFDEQYPTPPEAVFGDFDIVLCQNVMIYYAKEASEQIFSKIAHATACGGHLILGHAEEPQGVHGSIFRQLFKQSKIYKKI